MTSILRCPVCRQPLSLAVASYQCPAHHAFDVARQGHVNLLLAHKKHSKTPGDDQAMVRSRRRFLDHGHYCRVSDALNSAIADGCAALLPTTVANILDAGCGEGYYLQRLRAALAREGAAAPLPITYFGVDVAKYAVQQATQRDRGVAWFVASINDLPFMDGSLDFVLNVFSPANIGEFSRILKATGSLVYLSPGPRHLNGLREIIYPVTREHEESTISEKAREHFSPPTLTRVNYQLELGSREEIMDLLAMTPYYWNIDQPTQAKVAALEQLALDVDVEIRVFRKK